MAKRPSSWINLQDYLEANQTAGAAMSEKVGGETAAAGKSAADQLKAAQLKNASDVAKGTVAGTDSKVSADDAAQQAKAAEAGYQGPKDLGETDPTLAGNVANAVQKVQSAGDANSIGQAYYGKGPVGAGGGMFDSFLLSNSGNTATADAKSNYGQLGAQAKAAGATARDAADKAKATSATSASAWEKLAGDKATAAADAAYGATHKQVKPPPYALRNDIGYYAKASGRPVQEEMQTFTDFQQALVKDAGDVVWKTMNDMSLVSHVWGTASGGGFMGEGGRGKNDPFTAKGEELKANMHAGEAGTSNRSKSRGGVEGQHIEWSLDDYIVFRQMDPQQWSELRGLQARSQIGWIAKKKAELLGSAKSQWDSGAARQGLSAATGQKIGPL